MYNKREIEVTDYNTIIKMSDQENDQENDQELDIYTPREVSKENKYRLSHMKTYQYKKELTNRINKLQETYNSIITLYDKFVIHGSKSMLIIGDDKYELEIDDVRKAARRLGDSLKGFSAIIKLNRKKAGGRPKAVVYKIVTEAGLNFVTANPDDFGKLYTREESDDKDGTINYVKEDTDLLDSFEAAPRGYVRNQSLSGMFYTILYRNRIQRLRNNPEVKNPDSISKSFESVDNMTKNQLRNERKQLKVKRKEMGLSAIVGSDAIIDALNQPTAYDVTNVRAVPSKTEGKSTIEYTKVLQQPIDIDLTVLDVMNKLYNVVDQVFDPNYITMNDIHRIVALFEYRKEDNSKAHTIDKITDEKGRVIQNRMARMSDFDDAMRRDYQNIRNTRIANKKFYEGKDDKKGLSSRIEKVNTIYNKRIVSITKKLDKK